MDTLVETLEYKGYNIEIHFEPYPEDFNPRQDDNLGRMVCFSRSHNLGDDHGFPAHDLGNEISDLADNIAKYEDDKIVWLPMYAYIHGGITINTTGYSCPWDSGNIGLIYITYEMIRSEYRWKRITKKRIEKIEGYLRNEVKTYDHYVSGQVYGYKIKDGDGEDLDSCWGYLGNPDDYMILEAEKQIDYMIENNT